MFSSENCGRGLHGGLTGGNRIRERRRLMRNQEERRPGEDREFFATDCRDYTDKAGDKILGQAEKFLVLVDAHRSD